MKVSYWKTMSMYLIPTISILPYRLGGGYIQLSFWKWHITFDWGGEYE